MKFDTELLVNVSIAIFIAFIFIFVDRIVKIPVQIDVVLINQDEFTQIDNHYVDEIIKSTKPIIRDIKQVSLPLKEQLDESIINNWITKKVNEFAALHKFKSNFNDSYFITSTMTLYICCLNFSIEKTNIIYSFHEHCINRKRR